MSSGIRNIVFGLGLIGILWFGYSYLFQGDDALVTVNGGAGNSEVTQEAQELFAQLQQIKQVHISDALFSDPRFESLVDTRQIVLTEPTGRENPFLPLSATGE